MVEYIGPDETWGSIRSRLNGLATSRVRTAAVRNIVSALEVDESVAIQVLGASSGDETDEWPYLLGEWLGQQFPDFCVVYSVWMDGTQDFAGQVTLQEGAHGQRHIAFNGAETRKIEAGAIGDITGDLELRLDLSLDDWTPGSTTTMFARYGSSGSAGWRLRIDSTGRLILAWSPDGTAVVTATASTGLGFSDGARYQIKVELDVDNDASGWTVRFFYRLVGDTTWTQLGADVTGAGVTSVFNPPGRYYELGGYGNATSVINGKIYAAEIRQGIGGPIISPQPVEAWVQGASVSPDGGSPTIYLVNSSKAGGDISYYTTGNRLSLMLPDYRRSLFIASIGHNEDTQTSGKTWTDMLDSFLVSVKAQLPNSELAFITQNPQTGATRFLHKNRMAELKPWTNRNNIALLDTYRAFLDDGRPLTELIDQLDGTFVHPNAEGKLVQALAVQRAFDAEILR